MPPDPLVPSPFVNISRSIADGDAVNWEHLIRSGSLSEREVAAFRTLALMQQIQNTNPDTEDALLEIGFDIKDELGRGAFSTVYRAEDRALGREVALKVMKSEVPLASSDRRRFMKEARILAALDHPNIVRMLSIDQEEGKIRLCLERIKGRTLASVVEQEGPFTVNEAVRIGIDLCKALAALHEYGLAHRDLKPTNVMLTDEGRVVLLDFGLVHSIGPTDFKLVAGISGTPIVMAPEQFVAGSPLDEAVDIYSLGVLLYWMVSGRFPFESEDYEALRGAVLEGRYVQLLDRDQNLPQSLADVIKKAMAVKPDDRYGSASNFEKALMEIGPQRTVEGSAGARLQHLRKTKVWITMAFMVLTTLTLFIILNWSKPDIPEGVDPTTVEQIIREKPGIERIVFFGSEKEDPEYHLFSVAPDGTDLKKLTLSSGDAECPSISPLGTKICFAQREKYSNRQIHFMYSDSFTRYKITNTNSTWGANNPHWLDENTIIYQMGIKTGLNEMHKIKVSPVIGLPETLTNEFNMLYVSPDRPTFGNYDISFDRKWIVTCAQKPSDSVSFDLFIASLNRSGICLRWNAFINDRETQFKDLFPVWAPDSRRLYWCRATESGEGERPNEIVSARLGLIGGTISEDQIEIIRAASTGEIRLQGISMDGSQLLYHNERRDLGILDMVSGRDKPLLEDLESIGMDILGEADWGLLRFERIVFSAKITADSSYDIYYTDPLGNPKKSSEKYNLTEGLDGHAKSPIISPDGLKISFTLTCDESTSLLVMTGNGKNYRFLVQSDGAKSILLLDWLDTHSILYCLSNDPSKIMVVDLDGKQLTWMEPTKGAWIEGKRSPSGNMIALVQSYKPRSQATRIHIFNSETKEITSFYETENSGTENRHIQWGADGKTLFWEHRSILIPSALEFNIVCKLLNSVKDIGSFDYRVRTEKNRPCLLRAASPVGNQLLLSFEAHKNAVDLLLHDLQITESGKDEMNPSIIGPLSDIDSVDWGIICTAD